LRNDRRFRPPRHRNGLRLSWSYGALQSLHPTALAPVSVSMLPSCPQHPPGSRVFTRPDAPISQKAYRSLLS
jgi:hypothetical protein